jgi:hypothetical protein
MALQKLTTHSDTIAGEFNEGSASPRIPEIGKISGA